MYRLHFNAQILGLFFWVFKGCFREMIEFLLMSAKLLTVGLLKIRVFWNKGYGVITHFCDVSNNILSRDSNYIVDVVMWPKFGNCNISMREVIVTSIL